MIICCEWSWHTVFKSLIQFVYLYWNWSIEPNTLSLTTLKKKKKKKKEREIENNATLLVFEDSCIDVQKLLQRVLLFCLLIYSFIYL